MNSLIIKQTRSNIESPVCPINLNWADNPDIQKLLDVISEIIANEYIGVAKKNKGVFEIASGTSCPRNDGGIDSRFRGNDKEGR